MLLLLHLIITNVCLLSEPWSNLPITTSNPNFLASTRAHCRLCSRIINSCLFVNYARISTSTKTNQSLDLTSSFISSCLTSCFTSSGLIFILTIALENIFGCTISNNTNNNKIASKFKLSGKFGDIYYEQMN